METSAEMTTSFFFPFLLVLAEPALAFHALPPGVLDPLVGVAAEVDEFLGGGDAEAYDCKDSYGCKVRNDASVLRLGSRSSPKHNIFQHLFLILTLY